MTRLDDLPQMAEIVTAKYQEQQHQFAKLVTEENRLRTELTRLDDMRREARVPATNLTEMRAIGADVIWQGWVGRSKRALNMQLAQVLARKEGHLAAVRMAYGKVLIVNELRDAADSKARAKAAKDQLERAITQSMLRQ